MYFISKTIEISASHVLRLPYPSKCADFHGHNYMITVHIKAEKLNQEEMVYDFSKVKEVVMKFDHKHLNDLMAQPTAEHMAKRICKDVQEVLDTSATCYEVEVEETEGSCASYVQD